MKVFNVWDSAFINTFTRKEKALTGSNVKLSMLSEWVLWMCDPNRTKKTVFLTVEIVLLVAKKIVITFLSPLKVLLLFCLPWQKWSCTDKYPCWSFWWKLPHNAQSSAARWECYGCRMSLCSIHSGPQTWDGEYDKIPVYCTPSDTAAEQTLLLVFTMVHIL